MQTVEKLRLDSIVEEVYRRPGIPRGFAFAGLAGSGKSYLAEKFEAFGAEVFSFGAPLKRLAKAVESSAGAQDLGVKVQEFVETLIIPETIPSPSAPLDGSEVLYNLKDLLTSDWSFDGFNYMQGNFSLRRFFQKAGTEVGRHYYPNIWTEQLEAAVAGSNAGMIVIDDVRYANEVECAHGLDLIVVEVTAPGDIRYERIEGKYGTHAADSSWRSHSSEKMDFLTDIKVINDGRHEVADDLIRYVSTLEVE